MWKTRPQRDVIIQEEEKSMGISAVKMSDDDKQWLKNTPKTC